MPAAHPDTATACVKCGTAGGDVYGNTGRPIRYAGAPYGYSGELCSACGRAEAQRPIDIPASVFTHTAPPCNKFLLIIDDDRVSIDGCHDDAQGVAGAKHLINAVGWARPSTKARYVMLTIEAVPAFTGEVDEKAIATLNHAAGEVIGA